MGTFKSSARKISIRSSMFLVYLFAGAGIFLLIEGPPGEDRFKQGREKYDNLKRTFTSKYNITEADWKHLQGAVYNALKNGIIGESYVTRWNYGKAFFFSYNVITTVGYGQIVPKTVAGQIVMIIYALFGIPLTGFFLRTIGNELTSSIAVFVKYYERRMFNREAEKLEIKCAIIAGFLALFMLAFGAGIFCGSEEQQSWDYLGSFYFCFVSLTTIGFGDFVPGHLTDTNLGGGEQVGIEIALLVYYVIGLSIMSGVIVSISGVIEEKTKKFDVADPMDAIRNLRLENLNSKAMKKLGYKVDEGYIPSAIDHSHISQRRGTIIPDVDFPKRKTPTTTDRRRSSNLNNIEKDYKENISTKVSNGKHLNIPKPHRNNNDDVIAVKTDNVISIDVTPTPSSHASPQRSLSPDLPRKKISPTITNDSTNGSLNSHSERLRDTTCQSGTTDIHDSHATNSLHESVELISICELRNSSSLTDNVASVNDENIENPVLRVLETNEKDCNIPVANGTPVIKQYRTSASESSKSKDSPCIFHVEKDKNHRFGTQSSPVSKVSSVVTNSLFLRNRPASSNSDKLNKYGQKKFPAATIPTSSMKLYHKRVGLPAELFANHVSVSLNSPSSNINDLNVPNGEFDTLNSTKRKYSYQNPYFEMEDLPSFGREYSLSPPPSRSRSATLDSSH